MPDPLTALAIGLAFLFAGSVKGVLGMGLPTAAMGALSLAMAPAQAAALVVVPSLVTNVWQSLVGPSLKALLRRLWSMLACVCIGIWLGAGLLTSDTSGPIVALGLCLMAYAAVGLATVQIKVPPRAEPWLSPLVGIVTGLINGATGIFVIPAVPYLQALDLERDDLVQALGLSFVTSTIALSIVLARAGFFSPAVAGVSLAAVVPAVVGMVLGRALRRHISPALFRTFFFVGMLALGAHLTLRGLL